MRSLAVVAGPTAVGKSSLLQRLAEDEVLRVRMGMPKAPAATAGGLLQEPRGDLDALILHYDILRPHHKGFGSHADDPATSTLGCADEITFFTLRTTSVRLCAQLDQKVAHYRRPPKKLRKLKPMYENDAFVSEWYERWFEFIDCFCDVTTASYVVDTGRGYLVSPHPSAHPRGS